MKSALPSPSSSRSSVRYQALCSATMTSLLGRTSRRRGFSKPVTNDVAVKPSITRGVCPAWNDQRSACRDWIALGRRQVSRFDQKASAQLLIGIADGIGGYGLLGRPALLGRARGITQPKSQCSRCDCTNNGSHEVPPFVTSGPFRLGSLVLRLGLGHPRPRRGDRGSGFAQARKQPQAVIVGGVSLEAAPPARQDDTDTTSIIVNRRKGLYKHGHRGGPAEPVSNTRSAPQHGASDSYSAARFLSGASRKGCTRLA